MSKRIKKQKKRNTKSFKKNLKKKVNTSKYIGFQWSKVPKNIHRKIMGEDNPILNRRNKIRFVHDYKNLSEKGLNSVVEYLQSHKIMTSGCHPNSVMLSCINPKIKTIHGFVGVKLSIEEFEKRMSQIKPNITKGFITVNLEGYGTQYIDLTRKMKYFLHSWNEFNGIHFDLTKSLNSDLYDWWNYFPNESLDILNCNGEKEVKQIKKVISIFKKELQCEGERILNVQQLKMVS
tara:strand:- start:197 stop:898 length:702 start_codon:yes stop_codon:yes gene_type:complete